MDWEISSQADAKAPEGSTTRESILKPVVASLYQSGKTCREIEAEIDVSSRTIARWLKNLGLNNRKSGQRLVHTQMSDAKFLFDEYWTQNKSAEVIAKELKTTPKTVLKYMRKHGIPVRSTNAGRSFPEVGKRHSEWLKGRFAGDKNPNWRGGKVDPNIRLRVSHQSKEWSKAVRSRDGNKCQDCGKDSGRLHAHHVKPWKSFPELRFDVNNGITLCPVCHQKAHGFKFPQWVMENPHECRAPEKVMI